MHRRVIYPMATFLFLAFSVPSGAEEEARAVVESAITAQGGEEHVAKLTKAWRAKIKGSKDKLLITGERLYQSPGQVRIETTAEVNNGQKIRVIAVLNGDMGWQRVNGQTRQVQG